MLTVLLFIVVTIAITVAELRMRYNVKYRYFTYMLFPLRSLILTYKIHICKKQINRYKHFNYCACDAIYQLRNLVYHRDLCEVRSRKVFHDIFTEKYEQNKYI